MGLLGARTSHLNDRRCELCGGAMVLRTPDYHRLSGPGLYLCRMCDADAADPALTLPGPRLSDEKRRLEDQP